MAVRLGDVVEKALSSVGVTSERVEKWLGRKCGCKHRKEALNNLKFNQLTAWALRVVTGKEQNGKESLDKIIEESK